MITNLLLRLLPDMHFVQPLPKISKKLPGGTISHNSHNRNHQYQGR
jgi:hypothetical protein